MSDILIDSFDSFCSLYSSTTSSTLFFSVSNVSGSDSSEFNNSPSELPLNIKLSSLFKLSSSILNILLSDNLSGDCCNKFTSDVSITDEVLLFVNGKTSGLVRLQGELGFFENKIPIMISINKIFLPITRIFT